MNIAEFNSDNTFVGSEEELRLAKVDKKSLVAILEKA